MKIIGLVNEDFVNYKKASMFISMPFCTFKCDMENGCECCQNSQLAHTEIIQIDPEKLIKNYLENKITSAVVFGGLEPLDSYQELKDFIELFRKKSQDDIVIYTGYYEREIFDEIRELKQFPNIIIKYGRFIPGHSPIYDEVLGVNLASKNQFAVKIS